VARLHERVANQRRDMLHKLSTEMIRQNDVVCVIKNHNLARAISDVSWQEFRRQLEYKAV